MGIQRRALKAHVKTHGAADAFFRLIFHAFGALKPVVGVVVAVNKGNIMLFGKADIFLLADQILFDRMNIRIIEKDGEIDAGMNQSFHHFAGTGRAAGMQQQFIVAFRQA